MKRSFSNISDFPYNTNDGGAWLRKALDPAELAVEVVGMPDTATNARTVLNYQMQNDLLAPDSDTYIPSNVATYDATLYLYQNPIMFGMGVSYPQGTKDPSSGTLNINWATGKILFPPGTAPRTVTCFLNDQIEGASFKDKLDNFKRYCQRYRMIYGGAQAIPACSDMFDSGTIEATQQIYNPENTNEVDIVKYTTEQLGHISSVMGETSNDGRYGAYKKQIFNENDYPDSGSAIQNPTALFCRYKEGCYMPYKLRNPLIHPYLNSEETAVHEGPYIMTNICVYRYTVGTTVHAGYCDYDASTRELKINFDADYFAPNDSNNAYFFIKCYLKSGVPFWLSFHVVASGVGGVLDSTYYDWVPPSRIEAFETADYLHQEQNTTTQRTFTVYKSNATIGLNDEVTNYPFKVLPTVDSNIGVINFKSIAVQASIRLIFRLGFEFMIVSGGVYSPFKHKAPRFDQKALDSYISATHNMRDAFYGDAATSAGHQEFSTRILDLVAGNTGTGWYGQVAV